MKKTLVVGASENPDRYSNKAIQKLKSFGHEVIALGLRKGETHGVSIENEQLPFEGIDTVTMYVGAQNQDGYKDYIKSLSPKRVIFNPGAENPEFAKDLQSAGIETEEACTLVLLSVGGY